jgi:hypothetical protein
MARINRIMKALALLKGGLERLSATPEKPDIPDGVLTLQINGARWVQNPSDDQILTELANLRDEDGDSFAILSFTDMTYIQVAGDQRIDFDLEYQEGSVDAHFKATNENITLGQVVSAFIAFRDGDAAWKCSFTFEKTTLWRR